MTDLIARPTTPGFVDLTGAEHRSLVGGLHPSADRYCRVCDDETASYDHGGSICRACSEQAAACDDLGTQFGAVA